MARTAPRTPPYSVHAEKSLLGAILRAPQIIVEVRSIIPGGDVFFRSQHGELYDAIVDCHEEHPAEDAGELRGRLQATEVLGRIGGPVLLDDLVGHAPDAGAALGHARQIHDKALLRRLIDAASDIVADAYHADDGFAAVLDRGCRRLEALADAEADATSAPATRAAPSHRPIRRG
ncbi:MAG: DnaB-like helicase N-terminal domain-containing protein [Planctomycetota bacterium]|jgi:replicative DNA helicase